MKETFTQKMARKAFESPKIQESWQAHMRFFGPILEPAFPEDCPARIELCAALNYISRRDAAKGREKLAALETACQTSADEAALAFLRGLACEMTGDQAGMAAHYERAGDHGHSLYLPYLKLAKFYLAHHQYEKCEHNSRRAIACLDSGPSNPQLLAAAWANLASCLTMMHRYEEAQEAMARSKALHPTVPSRAASEALLLALGEDEAGARQCLEELKAQTPAVYEPVKASIERVLRREDPLFFPVELDQSKLPAFWAWFAGYEKELELQGEAALGPVAHQLLKTFPFLEEPPILTLTDRCLAVKDLYITAAAQAYDSLLAACPPSIRERWEFEVVHY